MAPDILVVSRTFAPKEGGIEEHIYNRCLQEPERVIVAAASCSGDKAFDRAQPFISYRWWMPNHFKLGIIGSLFKQALTLLGSLILGIKLYFRYQYRYIEWGHGYDFPTLLLLSYLLPVRCYLYLHGNDLLCPLRNPLLKQIFAWTLKKSDGIICNSSFTQDYLKKHFLFETPSWVINPSVRISKFGNLDRIANTEALRAEVRKAHGIPTDAIVILSVGRLVRRKGFDRVIATLPILLKDFNIHYLICGQGAMAAELQALANSLGVEERVHFAGYVPNESLAGYYIACDLFALLTFFDVSKASIEGFGIVYREAGYFGKPVVASRVGGVVDAVLHEENGLLVTPESADELVAAIGRLCRDPQLREELGRKGQEIASQSTFHTLPYLIEHKDL